MGVVELLNLTQHLHVLGGDKVDGNTLPTETTTSTDPVDVVLLAGWQVVVDDQGDLLDVDTTGEEVGGDEDTGGTGSELLHDDLSGGLVHVTVHGGHGELTGVELLGEPVDLAAGGAEDDGLGNGDSLVEVTEGVELPLFLLDGDVCEEAGARQRKSKAGGHLPLTELPDTLEGQLLLLDQNPDGVPHELLGDLENVVGHGGREEDDLGLGWQELEDVVHVLGETLGKHLIGLVEGEDLDVVSLEESTVDH